jgi:hypothetical protein
MDLIYFKGSMVQNFRVSIVLELGTLNPES